MPAVAHLLSPLHTQCESNLRWKGAVCVDLDPHIVRLATSHIHLRVNADSLTAKAEAKRYTYLSHQLEQRVCTY